MELSSKIIPFHIVQTLIEPYTNRHCDIILGLCKESQGQNHGVHKIRLPGV